MTNLSLSMRKTLSRIIIDSKNHLRSKYIAQIKNKDSSKNNINK